MEKVKYIRREVRKINYYGLRGASLMAKRAKKSVCNLGSIPGSVRSPREWIPTPVFLPHEQRTLVSYSRWCLRKDHQIVC